MARLPAAFWLGLIVVGAIVMLGALVTAHAAVTQEPPDLQFRPQSAAESETGLLPCDVPEKPLARVLMYLRAKDGTMIVIGAYDIRRRC